MQRVQGRAGGAVLVTAACVLLLQLLLRAWAAHSSWFFQDDFYLAARASRGLTTDFLLQDYSGHLMPAGLLLVWLTTAIAPLEWGPPLAILLLMQLAVGVALVRVVLLVLGRTWVALVPVTMFACTPLTLNSVLWWGSGLQALPHQLALLLAVDGHLRWSRDGRRRYAVQSLLAVAGGLAFYEKVLLVPVLLVLLSLLVLSMDHGWRRLVVPRAQRAYWAAHALLVTAYAAAYLLRTGGPGGSSSPPGDWWTVAVEASRTVAVALLGGPWRGGGDMPIAAHLAPPPPATAAVALAAGAGVLWTVWRGGRRAGAAWLVLVGYLVLDAGLLVAARGALAPFLASDPRYYTDAAPVAALALALALRAVRDRQGGLRVPSTPVAVALAAAAAVVAGGSVLTTVELAGLAERNSARAYVDRMRAELHADPDAALGDSPAAKVAIVRAFLGGEASVAHVIAPLPEADRLTRPGRHLRVFDQQGRLVEGFLLNRLHAEPGPVPDCGYPVTDRPLVVRLDPPAPAPRYDGHVRVGYFTGSARQGSITVAGHRHDVVFEPGLNEWWVPVDGRPDEVVVVAEESPHVLCVTEVEAAKAWPPAE